MITSIPTLTHDMKREAKRLARNTSAEVLAETVRCIVHELDMATGPSAKRQELANHAAVVRLAQDKQREEQRVVWLAERIAQAERASQASNARWAPWRGSRRRRAA